MSFEVSEGGAYAVLYTVLGLFTIIAFVASGLLGTSPVWEKLGCIMLGSRKFSFFLTNKAERRKNAEREESARAQEPRREGDDSPKVAVGSDNTP